ncbi:calcium-binding protein [Rhizobium sp. NXC14]|uniref:calcium-binding protein n=1 Tax=Rhizobium sp. NXC14 TaxID=1981173 RepID=UPI001FDABC57|nr:calcium-binding protein [Rhizobium sp. NXC14]
MSMYSSMYVGTESNDTINASNDDDMIFGKGGDDEIDARAGADRVFSGGGDDFVIGGVGNDRIHGEDGNDFLFGGRDEGHISGQDDDFIDGGRGDDEILVGDGRDSLMGGEGSDAFIFKFHDPTPGTPEPGSHVGEIPAPVSTILDFNSAQDTFQFTSGFFNYDGNGEDAPVETFYSGNASGASGQRIVVITDKSFASASDARGAISGGHDGDIIVYHNAKTDTADLAYVSSPEQVNVFAHLSEVHSVSDLANMHLAASDFMFV